MATVRHVQGKRSVNKTEKSLKRGILDLIISQEAEHCEIYARREGGGGGGALTQHQLAGMSALTTVSVETITLLFPPSRPIWLTRHHTDTISGSWRRILVERQSQRNVLPHRKDSFGNDAAPPWVDTIQFSPIRREAWKF